MTDLLKTQIHESLKLALPDGLHELVSDIAREVLRAQPVNLYQFIADYLSGLLVTRENLTIASRVCNDICKGICHEELEDELKNIGLNEKDSDTVKCVVEKHFLQGNTNEANLMQKLIGKTDIEEHHLPRIQDAIRKAYLRYQDNHTALHESSSDEFEDETKKAVKHTLRLYRKTKPNKEQEHQMATRIQAAYRGYGVRQKLSGRTKPKNMSIRFDYKDIPKHEQGSIKVLSSAESYRHLESPEPQSSGSSSDSRLSTEPSKKSQEELFYQKKLLEEFADTKDKKTEIIEDDVSTDKTKHEEEQVLVYLPEKQDKKYDGIGKAEEASANCDKPIDMEDLYETEDTQIKSQFYDIIEEEIISDDSGQLLIDEEVYDENKDEISEDTIEEIVSSDNSDFKNIQSESDPINIKEFLEKAIYKDVEENDVDKQKRMSSFHDYKSDDVLDDTGSNILRFSGRDKISFGKVNNINDKNHGLPGGRKSLKSQKHEKTKSHTSIEQVDDKVNVNQIASVSRSSSKVEKAHDDDEYIEGDPVDVHLDNENPLSDF